MKNIKEIWKENKNEIIVGSIIGGMAVAALLTRRYYRSNFELIPKGMTFISWKPSGKFISLEVAKEALDLNANNASAFAIVKDGSDYVGILLSDGVVLP